jgi:hypothetical protein
MAFGGTYFRIMRGVQERILTGHVAWRATKRRSPYCDQKGGTQAAVCALERCLHFKPFEACVRQP